MNKEKDVKECLLKTIEGGGVPLVLDVESDDMTLRYTSLSDSVEDVMRNFQIWISRNSLKAEDIWYADLFRIEGPHIQRHVASLFVEPDNVSIRYEPAPENSTLQPFGRRPGLRRRIRSFMAQFN